MVTQELVDKVSAKFQAGHTRNEVKDTLIEEGYEENDVDHAIFEIQKAALMEIPVYKYFDGLFKKWDEKTATWPVHKTLSIIGAIGLVLLALAGLFYVIIDPMGTRTFDSDAKREEVFRQAEAAVNKYYVENLSYPPNLDALVPKYLRSVPRDPKRKDAYDYKILEDGFNYQLCVNYEAHGPDCASSYVSDAIPTVLPTPEEGSGDSAADYSISGRVFNDANGNGKLDKEGVFSGASVEISDKTGNPYCHLISDRQGHYECPLKKAGSYVVTLGIPADYSSTAKNPQQVVLTQGEPSSEVLFGIRKK